MFLRVSFASRGLVRYVPPEGESKKGQSGPCSVLRVSTAPTCITWASPDARRQLGPVRPWPALVSRSPKPSAPVARGQRRGSISSPRGLRVGALKSGVPAVSTSAYQCEFRRLTRTRATSCTARVGRHARGGTSRRPSRSAADDDRDGAIGEDWLNGYGDDGDAA